MSIEETYPEQQDQASRGQASPVAVAGLGVDIVEIPRMEAILQRSPAFERKVFTQAERDSCRSKHNPRGRHHRHPHIPEPHPRHRCGKRHRHQGGH